MIGTTLGHYRVLEKIGAGGMGVVYRAHDEQLDRDVALKVLPPGTLSDEASRKRIRKEALALSKLNHPNIATVHDFGTQEGVDYVVMEYIVGRTLEYQLHGKSLPESEVIRLGMQIAAALEEAGERGIVHRDLKPGNLMVTAKGQLKVLDFGLARPLHTEAGDLTLSFTDLQSATGTMPYMSPEQLREQEVDVRSDIWAAGAVLYEMATGHRAFSETQYPRLVDAILNRAPRRPTELNPEISPGLENIILRALEKEPARRYQSARELLIAQEQLQVSSRSVPGIPRPRIPRRLRDPSKKLLLAAGFLALLLASWLGWRSWVAHTSTRPHPLVLIGEFENRTGEAVFDQTLQELIATALEQSHFVSILPRSRVQDALVRMERLPKTPIDETIGREICQREGLQALVLGSISRLGDRYVLLARAESPSGQNLASVQDVAPGAGQVLAQLDGIVQRLRTGLGESLASVKESSAPLAQVTSSSLEAVRYFTLGKQRLHAGDPRGAVSLMERAIQVDPSFAMAHEYLGVAYQNMSELDRSEDELRVAAQLSNRVTETERLKILGDYNLIIYNFDEACEDFRALVQLQPQDPAPYQGLGICYARKMDMDASLAQTQKGLEMQPRSVSVRYNLSRTYFMKGDKARAIEVAQEILRENPSYADAMRIVGVTYELDGKFGEARRMFEGMIRSGGDGEVVGQSALADLALATGRYREARPHLEAGAVAADKQGDKLAAAREKIVLAELLFSTGSPGQAVQVLSQIQPATADPTLILLLGRAYARLRQLGEAQKMLRMMTELSVKKPYPRLRSLQNALQAEVSLAEGKPAVAVEAAEKADQFSDTTGALETLGRCYEAAARNDEAIRAYERLLARAPELADSEDGPTFHRVVELHYHLGTLYQKTGQTDLARTQLQTFLKAWSEADANLEMRKDAEQRLHNTAHIRSLASGNPTPAT